MGGRELPKPGLQSPRVEQQWGTQLYLRHCSGFLEPSGRHSLSIYTLVYPPYPNYIFWIPRDMRQLFACNMCAISCLIYVPDTTDGTPALYFHFSLHCSDLFRTGKIPSYNAPRHRTQPPARTMYIPTSSLDSKHSETYLNLYLY